MNSPHSTSAVYQRPATARPVNRAAAIYPWVIGLSLLASLWSILIDPLAGASQVGPLLQARLMLEQGLASATIDPGQALPALLLAGIHQLSGLPLLEAGLLVNSVLYALLCLAFVSCCKQLGGGSRVLWFAVAVILLLPQLNLYRSTISADAGFWALVLMSLQQLLAYNRRPVLSHQLGWLACICTAGLLQPMILLLAVLAPLSLLHTLPRRQRWGGFLRLELPAVASTWALIAWTPAGSSLLEASYQAPAWLWVSLSQSMPALMATQASIATGGAVIALALWQGLRGLGAAYALILVVGSWRGWTHNIPQPARWIITCYLLICLLCLVWTGLSQQHTPLQQTLLPTLLALLFVPFILNRLWLAESWHWPARAAVVLLLVLVISDGLKNTHHRQQGLGQAAQWLRENTPLQARVLSNSPPLAWLSERPVNWRQMPPAAELELASADWDYLVMSSEHTPLMQWYPLAQHPGLTVREVFHAADGKLVVIFAKLPAAAP
jgi:hypothetical protein